ncbi:MAG TPA: PspC domain-containing protein, partial [Trueperaceae bacterium]|nr:PspC domain-containing protein [Trueperaceae bacterium]
WRRARRGASVITEQRPARGGRGPAHGQSPLRRSRSERRLTGLCGGIAELTGASPTAIRVLFVVTSVLTLGTVAVGYAALSLLIPASG